MDALAVTGTTEAAAEPGSLFHAADLSNTAAAIIAGALDFCGRKIGADGRQVVVDRLRAGDADACRYLRYGLAARLGEQIGALDGNARAVYLFDDADTAEETWFDEGTPGAPVHLVVWAQPKTAALHSLAEALDSALLPGYTALSGRHQLGHLLAVDLVDDADVASRRGWGVLLSSVRHAPLRVWNAEV